MAATKFRLILSQGAYYVSEPNIGTCEVIVHPLENKLRCKRCQIGIDDDGDGNCGVCVGLDDAQAMRVKIGMGRL